ncbi:hypothetical protein BU14_0303s0010 [Porphyra umbilicalis]|uniref:Uncharacterized protein n=1 Tax=Porphyra umbilicalis TaxID=2786 RepID=A0A1X6P024_PORUM|nr:hypothetical protein BU14_0303s0010 [Porphyra umbilicalis]|eukprot:OSX74177.1 hypothetical protein BU14_0303s0010 [Porphyra umbilicalis]
MQAMGDVRQPTLRTRSCALPHRRQYHHHSPGSLKSTPPQGKRWEVGVGRLNIGNCLASRCWDNAWWQSTHPTSQCPVSPATLRHSKPPRRQHLHEPVASGCVKPNQRCTLEPPLPRQHRPAWTRQSLHSPAVPPERGPAAGPQRPTAASGPTQTGTMTSAQRPRLPPPPRLGLVACANRKADHPLAKTEMPPADQPPSPYTCSPSSSEKEAPGGGSGGRKASGSPLACAAGSTDWKPAVRRQLTTAIPAANATATPNSGASQPRKPPPPPSPLPVPPTVPPPSSTAPTTPVENVFLPPALVAPGDGEGAGELPTRGGTSLLP